MLGTTENELGIRKWIEDQGHELITTSDKEGEGSEFDKHLVDAEVIITTPYVPPEATPQCTLLRPTTHFGCGTLADLAEVT
jgi:formate dehydrogenase